MSVQARARCQCQQHIQTEVLNLAFHQPRNTRLSDTKTPRRFCLSPALFFQPLGSAYHDLGAHFHHFGLCSAKAEICKYIAAAFSDGEGFFFHFSVLTNFL